MAPEMLAKYNICDVGLAIHTKLTFMPSEFSYTSFCLENLLSMPQKNNKSFKPSYTLNPSSLKPQQLQKKSSP